MDKFNMKKISSVAVALLLTCGLSSNAQAKNSITVWEDLSKSAGLEMAAKDFERDFDCSVNLVEKDAIGQYAEIERMARSGIPVPDAFIMISDKVTEAASKNLIAEIPVMNTEKNRYMTASVKPFIINSKMYAIPRSIESLVIFYNKDLIKTPIETLAGYEELAKSLKEKGKYSLIGKLDNLYYSYGFLSGYGAYIFGINPDGSYNTNDIGLNNDGAVKGLKVVSDYARNYVPKEALDHIDGLKNIDELFIKGEAAAVINGPWAVEKYKKSGVNYAVTTLPKLSNGMPLTPFYAVKGYSIPKKAKNKTLAAKFLIYANQPKYAMQRYQKISELPPVKELLANPLIIQDEVATAVSNQVLHTVHIPNIPKMTKVWENMESALEMAISLKDCDIKAIVDKAVENIKKD